MSSTGDKIAGYAKSAIGKKYKWGAKGPDEFDCSGLAIWCHKKVDIIISGDSLTLSNCGTDVSNNLKPGDLVFYATNDSSNNVSHVGVYIGNNKMVHAAGSKDGVKEATITSDYWQTRFKGARRNW